MAARLAGPVIESPLPAQLQRGAYEEMPALLAEWNVTPAAIQKYGVPAGMFARRALLWGCSLPVPAGLLLPKPRSADQPPSSVTRSCRIQFVFETVPLPPAPALASWLTWLGAMQPLGPALGHSQETHRRPSFRWEALSHA